MNLSVVIPAFNEEDNIKQTVEDVARELPESEIIVVNDRSTDKTYDILRELWMQMSNLVVLNNDKNMGHGYTVVKGLRAATKDYVLYIDADRQIKLENVKNIPEGYDFVSGWRLNRSDKLFRKVISFCLKSTNLIFHRMYIKDANCPFKFYKRKSLLPLLDELPSTNIVPVACLEVLARKEGLQTISIATPHFPYDGVRQGFLQSFNLKMYKFLWSAFWEVVRL